MQKIERLLGDLLDKTFMTEDELLFTVLAGEFFTLENVSKQHQKYCSDLRDGRLVALTFYGAHVPVIRVDGGVFRLAAIRLDAANEEVRGRATDLCRILCLTKARRPIELFRP